MINETPGSILKAQQERKAWATIDDPNSTKQQRREAEKILRNNTYKGSDKNG
jgi:hypothetical protein